MAIVDLTKRGVPEPQYHCANCMRTIGAVEQPYQWGESIVCPQCCALLQSGQEPGQLETQHPVVQVYVDQRPSRHRKISGLGIASLVLGLLGIAFFWFLPLSLGLATIGIVLGMVGMIVAANDKYVGRGMPLLGMCASLVPFLLWIALLLGISVAIRGESSVVAVPPTRTEEGPPRVSGKSTAPEIQATDVSPPRVLGPRHLPAIDPALKLDVNQEDQVRDRYGDPDVEGSNENVKPRPAEIFKRLVYDPEHVRIVMAPNDDVGKYYTGPVTAWAITAYQDSRDDTPISREEAENRLARRVAKRTKPIIGR